MSRSIASAFGSVFTSKILVFLAAALTTPVLTRSLGATQYGRYGTILAIFGMVEILMSSGIGSGLQKYLSETRNMANWKDYVWGFYLRLGIILAVVLATTSILAVQTGVVESMLGGTYVPLFYVLAILFITHQFRETVRRTLMGLKLEKYSEPLNVLSKVVFAVSAIALVLSGYGVSGALMGQILANFIIFLVGFVLVRKHLSTRTALRKVPIDFPRSELVSFSGGTTIYVLLLSSLYHIDVLMLQTAVDDTIVGYYKAALVTVEMLWLAPRSIQQTMIQSMSDRWADGKTEEISQISAQVTRYVILLTVLCAIGLATLATDFIPLYFGQEYEAAVPAVLLLLPGTVGFAAVRPLLSITHAKGTMRPLVIATGIAAGLNLVLNALLIPRYGMVGAAVATTIGYGSLGITQLACAKYVGYNPIQLASLTRIMMTCVIGGFAIWVLGMLFTGFTALLVVPPLGGLCFIVSAIWTGAITEEEVSNICQKLGQ